MPSANEKPRPDDSNNGKDDLDLDNIPPNITTLTMEEEFSIRAFDMDIDSAKDIDKLKKLIKSLNLQWTMKEKYYKHVIKHKGVF